MAGSPYVRDLAHRDVIDLHIFLYLPATYGSS
jgi:hypothetical protein